MKIDIECGYCTDYLTEYADYAYCKGCYDGAQKKIKETNEYCKKLESRINELEEMIFNLTESEE